MAGPQLENGYTSIANEILERLVKLHLSANQWQVLLCIIRKTYGFHKKVDYIANWQLCKATGLCKAVISRALHELESRDIIIRRGKNIGIQKDWERWQELAKQSTNKKLAESSTELAESSTELAIQSTELAKQSTKVSSCAVAQKIKETITKETIQKKAQVIVLVKERLPFWIDKETWEAFLEMRKKKRAVPGDRAKELLVRKLQKLRDAGHDPNEVLNQSIMNCYTGVFEVKGRQNGTYSRDNQARRLPKKYLTPKEHFGDKKGG